MSGAIFAYISHLNKPPIGTEPIELESTRAIEGAGVTHLTFRVVK